MTTRTVSTIAQEAYNAGMADCRHIYCYGERCRYATAADSPAIKLRRAEGLQRRREVRALESAGWSANDIAAKFSITRQRVYQILKRK